MAQYTFDYAANSEHLKPTVNISNTLEQLAMDTLKAYGAPDKDLGGESGG
jgi:hypothetical protein